MDNFIRALCAGLIVLILPGFAWLVWFWDSDQDIFERLADAVGLSIAFTALAAMAAFLVTWKYSAAGLILLYGAAGLIVLAGVWVRKTRRENAPDPSLTKYSVLAGQVDESSSSETPIVDHKRTWLRYILFLAVFTTILAWRFFQVRDLVLPAWVDSVHHVIIVRLILERGGLPDTLEPYLAVPFYYHFAFHALAAVYSFLADLSPDKAVIWIGQMLNAAVALSIYRLGKALWADWRRAGLAALLVGFVLQMPAYYVTWGRYTLLTGLILLPLAMAVVTEIVQQGASRLRLANLALLTAGLLLTHYFAAILLALFLVIMIGQAAYEDFCQGTFTRNGRWIPLVMSAVVGVILAAPWMLRTWGFAQGALKVGAIPLSKAAVEAFYFPNYLSYLWGLLRPRRNYVMIFLALFGLMLTAWRKETRGFALWAVAIGLLCLPWGFYLAPFRPDHAIIVLFLPGALLVSDLFVTLEERLDVGRISKVKTILLGAVITILVLWGLWDTRSIINTSTIIADKSDMEAIKWIGSHTPQKARFFINVTPWLSSTYRGVDGGWWITPLTGRGALLPAVIYTSGSRDYVLHINTLAERTSKIQSCTPDFWELIREEDLTYIYVKKNSGSLQPAGLEGCPNLELVYEQDGVYIYRVVNKNIYLISLKYIFFVKFDTLPCL